MKLSDLKFEDLDTKSVTTRVFLMDEWDTGAPLVACAITQSVMADGTTKTDISFDFEFNKAKADIENLHLQIMNSDLPNHDAAVSAAFAKISVTEGERAEERENDRHSSVQSSDTACNSLEDEHYVQELNELTLRIERILQPFGDLNRFIVTWDVDAFESDLWDIAVNMLESNCSMFNIRRRVAKEYITAILTGAQERLRSWWRSKLKRL